MFKFVSKFKELCIEGVNKFIVIVDNDFKSECLGVCMLFGISLKGRK